MKNGKEKEILSQSTHTKNRSEQVENEVYTAEVSFRVETHKCRASSAASPLHGEFVFKEAKLH